MITTTLAPLLLHGPAAAGQLTYSAGSIWDIGANFKAQGIPFAVYILMGGVAIIAAWQYFVLANKTHALRVVAVGVVLIGIIGALPSLGIMSRDTVNSITNSGGFR